MATSARRRSRIGYFAAVYVRITEAIKTGVETGQFADGGWVERLDVAFASRYLDAVRRFESGAVSGRAWDLAFKAASRARPIILQHVLLGINAHINYDLGIATAANAGDDLQSRYADFAKVNEFAGLEVSQLQSRLAKVSPCLAVLDLVEGPAADRAVVNFGIDRARDQAWQAAELLNCLPSERLGQELQVLDRNAENLGRLILDPPGLLLKLSLRAVRALELDGVRSVLAHL